MKITRGIFTLLATLFAAVSLCCATARAETTVRPRSEAAPAESETAPTEKSSGTRKVERSTGGSSATAPVEAPRAEPPTTEPPAAAQTTPIPEVITPSPETESVLQQARDYKFGVSVAGSFLGIFIPTKYGPAINWDINRRWTAELSYFGGSYSFSNSYIDIGGFKENLILLNSRYFPREGTFNWIFGLSRQQYVASLGNDIASRATGYTNDFNITVETIGLQVGLGNRWIYKHVMIGADWLVVNIPFSASRTSAPALDSAVTNPDDRRRIDDAIKIMRYLPSGALAKLTLGFAF